MWEGTKCLPIVNDEGGNFFYLGVSKMDVIDFVDEARVSSLSWSSLPSMLRGELMTQSNSPNEGL